MDTGKIEEGKDESKGRKSPEKQERMWKYILKKKKSGESLKKKEVIK